MKKHCNLSHMTISGWNSRYLEILKDFKYDRTADFESAKLLNSIIKRNVSNKDLLSAIKGKSVFVIGAGPSLSFSVPILKKFKNLKIVADGAAKALLENKIKPDIVVTDLDGDYDTLKKVGKTKTILLVHAHGDNKKSLKMASNFKNCIGTTQIKPFGKLCNFGGFTDGDRCVFLANHFKAKNIILFGMDFGNKIGKYSKIKIIDKQTKIKKLKRGKKLLEWLAAKSSSGLYTTSLPIKGFKKIHFRDLDKIIMQ